MPPVLREAARERARRQGGLSWALAGLLGLSLAAGCSTGPPSAGSQCRPRALPVTGVVVHGIHARASGDLILAGARRDVGPSGDGALVAVDARGEVAWSRTYGGTEDDALAAVLGLADGGALAVGATRSRGEGEQDLWILRVDAAGTPVTEHTRGGPFPDVGVDVVALGDGFAAVGHTGSTGAGAQSGWIVGLDAAAAPRWERTYAVGERQSVSDAVSLPDGGLVFAGNAAVAGALHGWLVSVGPDGAARWERTWPWAEGERVNALTRLDDGRLVLAGRAGAKTWLGAFDATGQALWTRRVGPEGSGQTALGITAGPAGSVVTVGTVIRPTSNTYAFWAIASDRAGDVAWSRVWVAGVPLDAAITKRGDGYLATLSGATDGRYSIRLLRLDPIGHLRCP